MGRSNGVTGERFPTAPMLWNCLPRGVSVHVHRGQSARLQNWDKLVLPMIDNRLPPPRRSRGARIVLPATIYQFRPATTPRHSARTVRSARRAEAVIFRVQLENELEQAAPEIPSLILRAGQFFFGPTAHAQAVLPGR